jgi:hypothetical protein
MKPEATRPLTIKDLPESWHRLIKERAAKRGLFVKDVILDVFEVGMKRRGMLGNENRE